MTSMTLAVLLQHFFTERLCTQMQASPHTIAGYRDTFRLLLRFASAEFGRPPTRLAVEDLDVELIGNFLHRRAVAFLDRAEMEALLAAPDRSTWTGRRDHA